MAQSKQKRPEPAVSAQGEQNCPWFHLNSCLADTHFVPGNGGGRRAISCPRSRVPSRPALGGFAPAILSLAPRRGVLFSVSALSDIVIYKTQVVKGCFSARSRKLSTFSVKNVDQSSRFSALRHRQLVTAVVVWVAGMSLYPVEVDGVIFTQLQQLLPQVGVEGGLLVPLDLLR